MNPASGNKYNFPDANGDWNYTDYSIVYGGTTNKIISIPPGE
jgi:hypothetical protein